VSESLATVDGKINDQPLMLWSEIGIVHSILVGSTFPEKVRKILAVAHSQVEDVTAGVVTGRSKGLAEPEAITVECEVANLKTLGA